MDSDGSDGSHVGVSELFPWSLQERHLDAMMEIERLKARSSKQQNSASA